MWLSHKCGHDSIFCAVSVRPVTPDAASVRPVGSKLTLPDRLGQELEEQRVVGHAIRFLVRERGLVDSWSAASVRAARTARAARLGMPALQRTAEDFGLIEDGVKVLAVEAGAEQRVAVHAGRELFVRLVEAGVSAPCRDS